MTPTRHTSRHTFRHVARMEWIKLASLRSTWWTLGLTVAAAVGIAAAVGANTEDGSGDLTNNALSGIAVGLLSMGVLGVLAMTAEHSSGTIRTSLSAAPDRTRLLAAKAVVFGAAALVVGEVASFVAFLAGGAALPDGVAAPSLGDPGVLRAVLLAGAGYCLIGLLGLGLGAIVRHTPAAIGVLVGGVYVVSQFVGAMSEALMGWVPVSIVANSLTTVEPMDGMLSPAAGLAVLAGYAAVALGVGGWLLERRDA
jgi:ABC-2 type transport system permease protein